jgi:hypothetical protein
MRRRCLAVLSALAALATAAPAAADDLDVVLQRNLEPIPAAAVDAAARGATTATLRFQHRIADDVPFADAPWAGTHNSYNSIAEMGPLLSPLDGNQRLTVLDQLRLGIRSLELDFHGMPQGVIVCHGTGPVGCTAEKSVAATLAPVAAWLRENPGEVVLLYLEDQIGDARQHDEAGAAVRAALGDLLWTPQAQRGCSPLPLDATRRDVLDDGAQVVVVGSCGSGSVWPGLSFSWGSEIRSEARPRGFADCVQPGIERDDYARIVRMFEDTTFVNTATTAAGAATKDDGLTPDTVRAMVTCGVDILGFDQLVPADPRLDALAWTWTAGEPTAGARCAYARLDGRWTTGACAAKRRAACRRADGTWVVPRGTTRRQRASRLCRRARAVIAAPRTGAESAALRAAAGGRTTWLGVRRTDDGRTFVPVDPR